MLIKINFENHNMLFQNPINIITCNKIEEIENCINKIESYSNEGYYVAGYISYESSMAFNRNNKTNPPNKNKLPLIMMGVFKDYLTTKKIDYMKHQYHNINLDAEVSLNEYKKIINKIKKQIEKGKTYQVNYTIGFKGTFKEDSLSYYNILQESNNAKYSAYIDFNNTKILSISPELFFKIEDNVITTKPMKGTSPRGINNKTDELQKQELFSAKNIAENIMIVDLLRNDLNKISKIGTVNVEKLFQAEKYPTVWQLTSTIKGEIKNNLSFLNILQALFPCGSITGAPKIKTMEIISQIEKEPREIYCGTIGFINPNMKKLIFNVAIRTLTIHNQKIKYNAGSGITFNSNDIEEYNEILNKTIVVNNTITKPDYLIESILLTDSKLFLLNEHLERLQQSAKYFDFKCPISTIKQDILNKIKKYPKNNYKIRLCLMCYGKFIINISPLNQMQIDKIHISHRKINKNNYFIYHKTSYRNHLPAIQQNHESISINNNGEITEFVNGNIVLYINNKWLTPKLTSGLLPGIMRDYYLKNNIIFDKILSTSDLLNANKIAFINSVRKWISIHSSVLKDLKESVIKMNQFNKFD